MREAPDSAGYAHHAAGGCLRSVPGGPAMKNGHRPSVGSHLGGGAVKPLQAVVFLCRHNMVQPKNKRHRPPFPGGSAFPLEGVPLRAPSIANEFIYGFRRLHCGALRHLLRQRLFPGGPPYYEAAAGLAGAARAVGSPSCRAAVRASWRRPTRGQGRGRHQRGCNIVLPHEQTRTPTWTSDPPRALLRRKVLLLKYSVAFVVMPGGAGHHDELLRTITAGPDRQGEGLPILALVDGMAGMSLGADAGASIERMVEAGTIGRKELEFVRVADTVEEATELLQDRLVEMWQQAHERTDAPKWWFLEEQGKQASKP